MSDWTPGPWKMRSKLCAVVVGQPITHTTATGGAVLIHNPEVCQLPPSYRREADAHLIAAAPELAGQLEAECVDLDLLELAIKDNAGRDELLARIGIMRGNNRAALAKARGEG